MNRLEPGKKYYYICFKTFKIKDSIECYSSVHNENFHNRNYFKTWEEAKKTLESIKKYMNLNEEYTTKISVNNKEYGLFVTRTFVERNRVDENQMKLKLDISVFDVNKEKRLSFEEIEEEELFTKISDFVKNMINKE